MNENGFDAAKFGLMPQLLTWSARKLFLNMGSAIDSTHEEDQIIENETRDSLVFRNPQPSNEAEERPSMPEALQLPKT